MVDLEQGDPDKLKGKVIAYSRFRELNRNHKGTIFEDIQDGNIVCIYSTIDLSEFTKKNKNEFDTPETKISDIVKENDKRLKQMHNVYQDKSSQEPKKFSVYSILLVGNAEGLPIGLEDIIFAGEYSDVLRCFNADQSMINRYMLELEEQKSRGQGIFSLNKLKTKKLIETYESVDKSHIQEHIINKYIIPMDRAVKNGLTKEFKKVQEEFVTEFSYGCDIFLDDFMQIPFLIKKGKKESIDLANIYLSKIVALKNEKYEDIPILIKQIEELNKIKNKQEK